MAKYVLYLITFGTFCSQFLAIADKVPVCDAPPEYERFRPCQRGEEFPVGTTVKYCCDVGFRFTGRNRLANCVLDEDDGKTNWDVPDYQCQPVSCSPPEPIANGQIIGSRFTFPNSVTYVCNAGYRLVGVKERYCETSGEWSGRVPHCNIVSCPNPDEIEHGKVSFSSTTYHSVVSYTCVAGYVIQGQGNLTCTEKGVWEPDTPTCVEVVCPMPEDPENGKVTLVSGRINKDSLISYSCNGKRILSGEVFAKCLDDGTWSINPPSCVDPCSVPRLGRGKMGVEEIGRYRTLFKQKPSGSLVNPGETLLLRCNEGFELPEEDITPGDIEVVCDMGILKPKPACHPLWCRKPLPNNGIGIPPTSPYNKENGSLLEYEDSCSRIGKTLQKKTALCVRGTWIITEAVCQDRRCKAKELEMLYVDTVGKELYEDGEAIQVRCQRKYEKTSEHDILCSDGQWKIKNSPCKPASCRHPPPAIEGGKSITSSGEHGTQANYYCLPPYGLVSKAPVKCSFGNWSGEIPVCKDTRCYTQHLSKYPGVKTENLIVRDQEYYNPTCRIEEYDGLGVMLQCNKGSWKGNLDQICKPGSCVVPYVVHGEFYHLVIEDHWYGDTRLLNVVRTNNVAEHNSYLLFKCHDGRKFQGRIETRGDGMEITCDKKQWTPKPECWFFPVTTTSAPATTDRPNGEESFIENASVLPETLRFNNETTDFNHTKSELFPTDITDQKLLRGCNYISSDQYLLAFNGYEVITEAILSHGQTLKFGCKPVGTLRLKGPDLITCIDGEWKPEESPKCFHPINERDVVISIRVQPNYHILPGDIIHVKKNNNVYIVCYVVGRNYWPQLYHSRNQSIISTNAANQEGTMYTYINIEKFTEEHSGTYICSSDVDSHKINIFVGGSDVTCRPPPEIEHGFKEGDKVTVGSEIVYRCQRGYQLTGIEKLQCQENGLWSNEPPSCSVIRCSIPPKINNGEVTFTSLSFGAEIVYKCKSDYKLIGEAKSWCGENGKWSNNPPLCKEEPSQCSSHDLLQILQEGVFGSNITADFMPSGSIVQLTCGSSSLVLFGNKQAVCSSKGMWIVGDTKCVNGCLSPEIPANSSLIIEGIKDVYRFGDTLTFSCPKKQKLSTEFEVIVCTFSGWSDVETPTCIPSKM